MSQEPIIEVNNLSKIYGNIKALDKLSFTVYNGDIFAFLGPNGSGKSTTIRLLLSLIHPDSGIIKIFGLPLSKNRISILSRLGALVEEPSFYSYLSAYKNLEILGKLSGKKISYKQIMEILELVDIGVRSNCPVKTYSHGMIQRLGIAQALLHDPELIILDEPYNGLDPKGIKDTREIILRLNKELGKTIFISSHILNEVEVMANRMMIIDKGVKVIEGKVKELLESLSFKIELGVSDPGKTVRILKEIGIKSLVDDNGLIFLFLKKPEIHHILQILVNKEINVFSIRPINTLESYFLSNT